MARDLPVPDPITSAGVTNTCLEAPGFLHMDTGESDFHCACLASEASAESSFELVPLQLLIAGVNIFSLGLFPHPYPGQGLLRAPKFPLINSYSGYNGYNGTYSIRLWRLRYL